MLPNTVGFYHDPYICFIDDYSKPILLNIGRAGRQCVSDRVLNCGLRIRTERRGAFFYDFSNVPEGSTDGFEGTDEERRLRIADATRYRVEVITAHMLCIHSMTQHETSCGGDYTRVVATHLVSVDSDLKKAHGATNAILLAQFQVDDIRGLWRAPEISHDIRRTVPVEIADDSVTALDWLIERDGWDANGQQPLLPGQRLGVLESLALLSQAGRALSEGLLRRSIVDSWAVSERMLMAGWKAHVRDRLGGGPNGEPAKLDRDSRRTIERWDARSVMQSMLLAGILDRRVYEWLDRARDHRNKWLHGRTTTVDRQAAAHSLYTAMMMVNWTYGLDIRIAC